MPNNDKGLDSLVVASRTVNRWVLGPIPAAGQDTLELMFSWTCDSSCAVSAHQLIAVFVSMSLRHLLVQK